MSHRIGAALASALLLSVGWRGAGAQDGGGPRPVFRFEPGLLMENFISAPRDSSSSTGFNLRFETRFPTDSRLLTPVIGASLVPYGMSGIGQSGRNAPAVFAGNVFPLVGAARTAGWATMDAPLLFYYTFGGGTRNARRLYGFDLYAQLALRLHIGDKMLKELSRFWSRVDAYAFLEQNLTPNVTYGMRHADRFNPVALFGISIPFGEEKRNAR